MDRSQVRLLLKDLYSVCARYGVTCIHGEFSVVSPNQGREEIDFVVRKGAFVRKQVTGEKVEMSEEELASS